MSRKNTLHEAIARAMPNEIVACSTSSAGMPISHDQCGPPRPIISMITVSTGMHSR